MGKKTFLWSKFWILFSFNWYDFSVDFFIDLQIHRSCSLTPSLRSKRCGYLYILSENFIQNLSCLPTRKPKKICWQYTASPKMRETSTLLAQNTGYLFEHSSGILTYYFEFAWSVPNRLNYDLAPSIPISPVFILWLWLLRTLEKKNKTNPAITQSVSIRLNGSISAENKCSKCLLWTINLIRWLFYTRKTSFPPSKTLCGN